MIFSNLYPIIYIVNACFVFLLIFTERKKPASVLTWSLLLILLPVIGLILYTFLGKGPNFGKRKRCLNKYREDEKYLDIKEKQQELIKGSNLREGIKDLINFNYESGSLFSNDNDVEIISDVSKYYNDMIFEIEAAKHFIHAEYYIIRDDESGKNFVNILAKKAAEGLKVRLLYDDFGCHKLRKDFFDCIVKSGGEVYSFFPSKIKFINRNLNYRNHRKIVVIDGKYAYTGGSNIGDEYLGKHKEIKPWTDCNIKIKGTAAMHLNLRFIQDFSFASKTMPKMEFHTPDYKGSLPVQVLSDGPDTIEGSIEQAYIKAIYNAKRRVYIQTPYFIPDEAFMLALTTVAKSGVDVKIMIPAKADKKLVYFGTLSYACELAKQGVQIYRREGFLHSKTLVIDDDICSIGSFNIDIRSFLLQFEITTFIYDKDFTTKLAEIFEFNLGYCKLLDIKYLINRPFKQKVMERLMRLLTPIM